MKDFYQDDEGEISLDYLFVYGTLRTQCETGAHKKYLQGASFIAPAKIRGQLFMVDYYPGLVLNETENWAQGEVYLLANENQLHELDVYEGCAIKSPQPHEYQRQLVTVTLASSETLPAWAYVYKNDTRNLHFIASGDFLQRDELISNY